MSLFFLPKKINLLLSTPLHRVGAMIVRAVPGLRYDVPDDTPAEMYAASSVAHALLIGLFFFFFLWFLQQANGGEQPLLRSFAYGGVLFALFLFTYLRLPSIEAGKKAEQVDKNLIFALKDLRLQIRSGIPLYNSLVNVAQAGYGQASIEFRIMARDVNVGMPIDKALHNISAKTKSLFLRRTATQLNNTIKAGASLEEALRTLVADLTTDRRNRIRSYLAELNLWILVYMMFAVVIPSIGATLLIVLSSFGGFGVTPVFFVVFMVVCVLIQAMLIGFMKTRRPAVQI